MTQEKKLTPASDEDVLFSLGYALQHDGRRAFRGADALMAKITAEHLLKMLKQHNFVIMQGEPAAAHSAPPPPKV